MVTGSGYNAAPFTSPRLVAAVASSKMFGKSGLPRVITNYLNLAAYAFCYILLYFVIYSAFFRAKISEKRIKKPTIFQIKKYQYLQQNNIIWQLS